MTWDKAMLKVGFSQLKTIILVSICSPYIALRNNDVIQGNLSSFYRYQLGIATVTVTFGSGRILPASPEPHPDLGSRSLVLLTCSSDVIKTSLIES